MIKLFALNNYLYVTLANGQIYSGLDTNFEFQQEEATGDTFDLVFKNIIIADGVLFSDFTDENDVPFATLQAFKDFYTVNSGAGGAGGGGLTDTELRATPLQVTVTNPTDLTAVETLLNDIKTFCQGIEENTDTVEGLIQDTIDQIVSTGATNNANLTDILTELNSIEGVNNDMLTALYNITVNTGLAGALDVRIAETNTRIGGLTETAPATDTASSGSNGRLQRIAQRLTTLIGSIGALILKQEDNSLTFGHNSGTSGTLTLTGGKQVKSISFFGTIASSCTINGGDSITAVAGGGYSNDNIKGVLLNPTIIFTNTTGYTVTYVS